MAYKDMTNSMGVPTGGPYGVLKSLRSMLNNSNFSICSVVFCWDGYPRLSERRVGMYPAYKNPDIVAPPTEEYVRELIENDLGRLDEIGQIRAALEKHPGLGDFLFSVTGVNLR